MLGTNNTSPIVIIDSDALIAILNKEDALFDRATETIEYLAARNAQIIYPVTTLTETITTLIRKLNQPSIAAKLVRQTSNGNLLVAPADDTLLIEALSIFNPTASKQRTIFDAMVAVTAKKLNTAYIFSFDSWYTQLGYTLASSLVETQKKAA